MRIYYLNPSGFEFLLHMCMQSAFRAESASIACACVELPTLLSGYPTSRPGPNRRDGPKPALARAVIRNDDTQPRWSHRLPQVKMIFHYGTRLITGSPLLYLNVLCYSPLIAC